MTDSLGLNPRGVVAAFDFSVSGCCSLIHSSRSTIFIILHNAAIYHDTKTWNVFSHSSPDSPVWYSFLPHQCSPRADASLAQITLSCNSWSCPPLTSGLLRWSLCSAATTSSVGRSCTTELSSLLAGTPLTLVPFSPIANSLKPCFLYAMRRHDRLVEVPERAQDLPGMWRRAAQSR